MAAKEYREIINKGYKEVFTGLPDKLEKQLEDDEVELGYDDMQNKMAIINKS